MAVDLEMAELGVRQQDAIVDDSRPDASAQGGEDDDARDTLGCTVVDLTQASGVCVVEDGHGAAEGITDVVLGMQAGPPLVEVGDEGDDAVACRGGEGDANRSVANGGGEVVDDLAHVEVNRGSLDPGAANVNSQHVVHG